jgi:adenosylhomocysteinase
MDGFELMPMNKACKIGDIFITVTGNKSVITKEHIENMKDGAILANSGHFDAEIDVEGLRKLAKITEQTRPGLERFEMPDGRSVYLCGEGRLVNLACAEGHPSIVMSLSFCGQSLAAEWGAKNSAKLEPKVYVLPEEIDQKIASLQLEAMGITKDTLTREQKEYLNSWQVGT